MGEIMAISSFLQVNGVDFPCPKVGFQYILSTVVDSGRNVNGQVVGQPIGRTLYKLDALQWAWLDPPTWQKMLKALSPFFVNVTFEDYRTGKPITIKMYHGDITAKPYFADKDSHEVTRYENCAVNLIDCGY